LENIKENEVWNNVEIRSEKFGGKAVRENRETCILEIVGASIKTKQEAIITYYKEMKPVTNIH
jgi:hypothetical protein